jgi:hypothetical protein
MNPPSNWVAADHDLALPGHAEKRTAADPWSNEYLPVPGKVEGS